MKQRVWQVVALGLVGALLQAGCAGGAGGTVGEDAAGPGVAQDDVDAMKSRMDRVALDLAAMAEEQELRAGAEGDLRDDLPSLSLESLAREGSGAPRGESGGSGILGSEQRDFEADPSVSPELDPGSTDPGLTDPALTDPGAGIEGQDGLGGRLALLDVPPVLARPDEPPQAAETPAERTTRLAEELSVSLDESARDGASAYRAALAKAGLGSHMEERPLPPPNLSITAQPVVEALTELHETLASHAEDPVAHLEDAAGAAREFADRVSEMVHLRITRVELCSRVDGFGQFTPLSTSKFLAGRTTPVILYVEVDHFGYREAERGWDSPDGEDEPRWNVELSQELELYRANETTPVWTKPAQSIVDTSRNKRRDFHIVHQFDMPSSLKLGMYRLKVRMTDAVTGAREESVINLQVVTDERLLK